MIFVSADPAQFLNMDVGQPRMGPYFSKFESPQAVVHPIVGQRSHFDETFDYNTDDESKAATMARSYHPEYDHMTSMNAFKRRLSIASLRSLDSVETNSPCAGVPPGDARNIAGEC